MRVTNEEIANQLEEIARLLELEEANPFRVRAYRDAAETVRAAEQPLADLLREEGRETLEELPGIGESLAGVIVEIIEQGWSSLLQRLRSEVTPTRIFQEVPGVGEKLAQHIVDELGISTLEELEQAAHDGRLARVRGFGEERVRNIQVSLAGMLSAAAQRRARKVEGEETREMPEPDVALLLDLDRAYREQAEAGKLRRIAPKRFNPTGEAWLPIMEVDRQGWHFTVLYSNTKRAHDLGKTRDWVVIYYRRDGVEDQVTVVTETRGSLGGKRVIRGREKACRRYYESRENGRDS